MFQSEPEPPNTKLCESLQVGRAKRVRLAAAPEASFEVLADLALRAVLCSPWQLGQDGTSSHHMLTHQRTSAAEVQQKHGIVSFI